MKINFYIPSYPKNPSGGHKVMYEYANKFAEDGFDVKVYHILTNEYIKYKTPHFFRVLRSKILYSDSKPKWFAFNQNISAENIPYLKDEYVRDADISISTMWACILEFDKIKKGGKKINLIQGYETWFGNTDLIHKSFKTNMIHIAISDYLADIVEKISNIRPTVITNGVEEKFCYNKESLSRNRHTIAMLYSPFECKGSKYGIEALKICKEKDKDLKATIFGVFPKPKDLPEWIEYNQTPKDLCSLYNSVAIFVSPSINEGWDLPCTEAMTCGCALVCTDIAGHKHFAIENNTAMLAKAENQEELAKKILYLINNDSERIRIANNGREYVKRYTIDNSYQRLKKIVL